MDIDNTIDVPVTGTRSFFYVISCYNSVSRWKFFIILMLCDNTCFPLIDVTVTIDIKLPLTLKIVIKHYVRYCSVVQLE